jgi:hypothetical protein
VARDRRDVGRPCRSFRGTLPRRGGDDAAGCHRRGGPGIAGRASGRHDRRHRSSRRLAMRRESRNPRRAGFGALRCLPPASCRSLPSRRCGRGRTGRHRSARTRRSSPPRWMRRSDGCPRRRARRRPKSPRRQPRPCRKEVPRRSPRRSRSRPPPPSQSPSSRRPGRAEARRADGGGSHRRAAAGGNERCRRDCAGCRSG